jgi:hypothetical protein
MRPSRRRPVNELTYALSKAYGGDARLLKCLGIANGFTIVRKA